MLHQILKDLLALADNEPFKWQKRKLKNGLTISIKNERTAYNLILSRVNTTPSPAEWVTVCKHWAYPIGEIKFSSDIKDNIGYLTGRIARQRSSACMNARAKQKGK